MGRLVVTLWRSSSWNTSSLIGPGIIRVQGSLWLAECRFPKVRRNDDSVDEKSSLSTKNVLAKNVFLVCSSKKIVLI